jgi:hypothetical protein
MPFFTGLYGLGLEEATCLGIGQVDIGAFLYASLDP